MVHLCTGCTVQKLHMNFCINSSEFRQSWSLGNNKDSYVKGYEIFINQKKDPVFPNYQKKTHMIKKKISYSRIMPNAHIH